MTDDPKTGHLPELDGAKETLHLLKANLLEEGSFDSGTLLLMDVKVCSIQLVLHLFRQMIHRFFSCTLFYFSPSCKFKDLNWRGCSEIAKENGIDLVAIHPGLVLKILIFCGGDSGTQKW